MPRLNSDHSRLSGAERERFSAALVGAFNVDGLDAMLANKVDRRRQRITLARNLDAMIFDIIDDAEMKSWTAELLQGARAARPTDVALFRFAQGYGLEPQTPSAVELERIIEPGLSPFDPVPWLTELMALLGRICRVEIKGTPVRGTGFLVGPDMVLTNHHVVEQVIDWQRAQEGVEVQGRTLPPRLLKCRFDHKVMGDDVPLSAGEVIDVHADRWLADYSLSGFGAFESTPVDQLDYAVLRLSEAMGDRIVDDGKGTARGWIDLPLLDPGLAEGTPLFILGHPLGDSLKLSLDTNAVIGVNGPRSRVRYRTNTQAGSSGSPCFTRDWTLAALHRAGEPGDDPTFNEGIPVAAIRNRWLDRIAERELQPWQLETLEQLLPG